jgi:Tol biopolymer transport system component
MWEVSVSGEKIRTLLEGEGLFYSAWGPKGMILYTSNPAKHPTIWLLDTMTGEQKLLITNGFFPAWSPDGSLIAFVRDGDLWIASADGRREQPVTSGLGRVVTPSWSWDGSRILFARFPPLDEERGAAGLYYVELAVRRELPTPMVASAIALTIILVTLLLLRFEPSNSKGSKTGFDSSFLNSKECIHCGSVSGCLFHLRCERLGIEASRTRARIIAGEGLCP